VSRWIDVTVPLDGGIVRWPGDPPFEIRRECDLSRGAECNLSSFAMCAHTGTHVDAPLHYSDHGASMDELAFDAVIGPARVLAIEEDVVTEACMEAFAIEPGERLLLKTSNSDRAWHHLPFQKTYVHIPPAAARWLALRKPLLVGIDYISVGATGDRGIETHRELLSAGIWILEGLNLHGVEPGNYDLVCLPLRIAGIEGAPARVLLGRISENRSA
jgi:arylformamidase